MLWAPNPLFWQVLQFQEKLKNEPARVKFMLFLYQKGISKIVGICRAGCLAVQNLVFLNLYEFA